MQGAHNWAENLNHIYKDHSYYKSYSNLQIQFWVNNNEFTLTFIWIDDMLGVLLTKEGVIT